MTDAGMVTAAPGASISRLQAQIGLVPPAASRYRAAAAVRLISRYRT